MTEQSVNHRIEIALTGESPFQKLVALAKEFKAEGMNQKEMLELFDRYREKHHNDQNETKYNAILDTMDLICGFCRTSTQLFESDSSK